MIGYRMPIFKDGNLLTKDMLEQLKFFSVHFANSSLIGYGDGFLNGGNVTGDREVLVLHRSLIKYKNSLLIIPEEVQIPLTKTEEWQSVKLVLTDLECTSEYEQIRLDFQVDTNLNKDEHILEVCRLRMQAGSVLRYDYAGFEDMNTGYDTLNLIYSDWSAYGGKGIHPEILRRFYKDAVHCAGKEPIDQAFLMQISNLQGRSCERELLMFYLNERLKEMKTERNNIEIYEGLKKALNEMKRGKRQHMEGRMERRIVVD